MMKKATPQRKPSFSTNGKGETLRTWPPDSDGRRKVEAWKNGRHLRTYYTVNGKVEK